MEVGNRAGEGQASGNLGIVHMHLNEGDKAGACHKAQHAMGTELGLTQMQTHAALGMGVALSLLVRADRQGLTAGASQDPGPHSLVSVSACLNDRGVRRQSGSELFRGDPPWGTISSLSPNPAGVQREGRSEIRSPMEQAVSPLMARIAGSTGCRRGGPGIQTVPRHFSRREHCYFTENAVSPLLLRARGQLG